MTEIKELEMDSPKYKFFCSVCNSGFNRKAHYEVHLKTNKHLRNEKKSKPKPPEIMNATKNNCDNSREYLNMIELLKTNNKISEQRVSDKCIIIDQLQHHIGELKQSIQTLQVSHESEKSKNSMACSSKDEKVSELIAQSNCLKDEIVKLKKDISFLEKKEDFSERFTNAQEKIKELAKKNELAENTINNHMKSYDQMRELCDTMIPKINEYGSLKNSHTKLTKENSELLKFREANVLLMEENNKMKVYAMQFKNLEKTQKQNEDLMKENVKFKEIIRSMEDYKKIKQEKDLLECRFDELSKKCKELLIQQRIADNRRRETEYNQRRSQIMSYESDDDGWN